MQFEALLDLGPDITPRAVVGDKGYASKSNRALARERGIAPVIPHKSNEKNRPAFFPKALYRARARIEQLVGKLKRFKRIALRCAARRPQEISVLLLHSPSASSLPNPSTGPRTAKSTGWPGVQERRDRRLDHGGSGIERFAPSACVRAAVSDPATGRSRPDRDLAWKGSAGVW